MSLQFYVGRLWSRQIKYFGLHVAFFIASLGITALSPMISYAQSGDIISLTSIQGAAPENCMSFTHAQKMSIARDPAIGEVKAQKQDAEAGVKLAKSDWLPQISTYARTATGSTGLVDGRTDNQIGVLATQRIFDFGHGKYGKRAAQELSLIHI